MFKVATTDTGELHFFLFCNLEDSHFSQGQEKILMLVVCLSTVDCTFQCLVLSITVAGLGNHFPCSSTEPLHLSLDMLPFKYVLVQSHFRKGRHFIEQTFLVNKCYPAMSMFIQVLACSTIQYCDESFNGAEVICRWLFIESSFFYKDPYTAGNLTHRFPRPRRKVVLLHPTLAQSSKRSP